MLTKKDSTFSIKSQMESIERDRLTKELKKRGEAVKNNINKSYNLEMFKRIWRRLYCEK